MKRWWTGVLRDTLFKRLFLLMWAALVASHLLAFNVTTRVHTMPGGGPSHVPVLPSLPPMGLGREPMSPGMPPPREHGPDEHAPPGADNAMREPFDPTMRQPAGPPGQRPPNAQGPQPFEGLPASALWIDYLVRIAAIGAAAWFGARWLSAPMRRLAEAADRLGHALGKNRAPPPMDEHSGTLEVRQTAQVFNTMAQRLHAQFEAQSMLLAAISHDLRTPLARLRMRLETMEEQPQTPRCVADVREMDALIGSVLDMVRNSHASGEPERVDLGALLQSLVDDLVEEGRPVVGDGEMTQAIVLAQPAALKRVLDNLIGNALRYGNSARIALALHAGEVVVTIDDAGPGIAPDQLERVFQPFYRLESSRNRSTGGAGLGLYIARDLMQRSGGELTLANRAEGGLRATLRMPLA